MNLETIEKLSDFVRENQATPFSRGVFDCCAATSKVIEIQTGLDLFAEYRGKYKTEKGALKALKKYGSIEHQLDKHFERIDPNFMNRGDIAMLTNGMMAFHFARTLIGTTETGLAPLKEKAKLAWRVK